MTRNSAGNMPEPMSFDDAGDQKFDLPALILALDRVNLYAIMISQGAKVNGLIDSC